MTRTVGEIFKLIGAIICALLMLSVSAYFIYILATLPQGNVVDEPHITSIPIIKDIYSIGARCIETHPFLFILCLVAILVDLLFSAPLEYLCEELPLGKIKDYPLGNTHLSRILRQIIPAIFVGIYITIHYLLVGLAPSKLQLCVNIILPIAILLVGSIFIAIAVVTFINGGLWGFIVRVPLIVVENFCLSIFFAKVGILGILISFVLSFTLSMLGGIGRAALISSIRDD